ncbi:MAG TPA: 6,7-dimethyl-8-ribityllumazine synthase [Planctomycetes bacterium]|nr:6,7-dimethyl-8-ribityllumazine synthase [Planctomycetota bacterium]
MPTVFQGQQDQVNGRFAIVVSRYNESITSKLLDGALKSLGSRGVKDEQLDVAWVPGAWEIPLVAKRLVKTGHYVAVLCLGAVIRGETTHDQYINRQVTDSLGRLAMESGVPVSFGVLTCNSLEQAMNRAGGNAGNKGVECAEAALEMVNLLAQIDD